MSDVSVQPITAGADGGGIGRRPEGVIGGFSRRPEGMVELPLTVAQERLWFLDRLEPGYPNHVEVVCRLHGPLDADALAAALAAVVDRHESLRARFLDRDGEPVQVIAQPAGLPVERIDLAGLPPQQREEQARELVTARRAAAFDLVQGPPLRASLLRLAVDDHILCLVLHHIVMDGASQAIFMDELRTRYEALLAGTAASTPGEPIQSRPALDYGDFAVWQRSRAAEAGPEDLRYWRERLADPPVLDLPTDLPRPAHRSGVGGHVQHELGAEMAQSVQRLARTARCTPFMVLLAAYQVLLCRYAGQQEVCVGSPVAGRSRPDLEPMIGLFVTLLVLRGDLSDDPTFRQLLIRTRSRALEAYAHPDIPFERLMGEVGGARDPSQSPLFQTLFVLQSQQGIDAATMLPGVHGEFYDSGYSPAMYDLTCDVWYAPETLSVLFRYDTTLFSAATVETLAGRFETLLRDALAEPDTPVSQLRLETPVEQERTLALGWPVDGSADGGPSTLDSVATSVLAAFEEQVARQPGAAAVSLGGDALTYAELDQRASELAALLRAHGVGPGALVGVCLERSPELIAALLAVWRAGGTQVPLDPGYPVTRLTHLLTESGAGHLLVRGQTRDRLDAAPDGPARARVLCLDGDGLGDGPGAAPGPEQVADPGPDPGPEPGREAGAGPGSTCAADGLAYVIFTSGSTGTPKGVAVPQSAVAVRVRWMCEQYRIGPGDRVLQFASTSFDTHVEEVYPALTSGAELVLLPADEQLPDFLAGPYADGLTVLDLPTPYWHELVAQGAAVRWPRDLRLMIIGADQVRSAAVAAWRELVGDRVELVNTYGPTETTVIATAARLGAAEAAGTPPIGRPISSTRVYVLDDRLVPVPHGLPGELFIAGAGLARGYLGRPGLTAQRFLPDPFGPPGTRMYRTGDRVRWRADGRLEFLGRLDKQVKIRGYRIEPGEIEAHLLRYPGVVQAVVVPRPDADGGSLTAYVVAAPGGAPAVSVVPTTPAPPADPAAPADPADPAALVAADLRGYLGGLLPAFMVPGSFVVLDRMPLTANGKLDLAALPEPDRVGPEPGWVAPRTDAEQLVAGVWAEVLGGGEPGAFDDFFELGGHSLLATKIIGRLSRALETEIPIRTLFEHRTVAGLAQAIEEQLTAEIDELSEEDAARLLAEAAPQGGRAS